MNTLEGHVCSIFPSLHVCVPRSFSLEWSCPFSSSRRNPPSPPVPSLSVLASAYQQNPRNSLLPPFMLE